MILNTNSLPVDPGGNVVERIVSMYLQSCTPATDSPLTGQHQFSAVSFFFFFIFGNNHAVPGTTTTTLEAADSPFAPLFLRP